MTLATVPREDPAVYDMLCRADSIGVFQVESRAQMNMLPRLKPRSFYDLVIEVAIVRPGPIQGDMVHPYLRRRDGVEAEHLSLARARARAHGRVATASSARPRACRCSRSRRCGSPWSRRKFSDAEANELRKAMATFRRRGTIGLLEEKMVARMVARGYDQDFAERCFNQIKGFGEYGFPESHAASFAHLVYVSSWLKCHYPAAFACALLNSQPMGFYAPAQIVRDAREHGVEVRAADVNLSDWDCTLEAGGADGRPALRLGLRQIDGLQEDEAEKLVAACVDAATGSQPRSPGCAGTTFRDVHDAVGAGAAAADRWRSSPRPTPSAPLGLDRRQALWEVRRSGAAEPLPLFAWSETRETAPSRRAAARRCALSRARRQRLPDAAPVAEGPSR